MLVSEIRYSVRTVCRRPVAPVFAAALLALGIGSGAAVIGSANSVIRRSLPVARPAELRILRWHASAPIPGSLVREAPAFPGYSTYSGFDVLSGVSVSARAFQALSSRPKPFSGILAFAPVAPASWSGGKVPLVARGRRTSAAVSVISNNYFPVLGLSAAAGRLIEAKPGGQAAPVAVISYALWGKLFGRSPKAIGTQIVIMNKPFTLIGVAPEGYRGLVNGWPAEVWVPLSQATGLSCWGEPCGRVLDDPSWWGLTTIARLPKDADPATAARRIEEELNAELAAGHAGGQMRRSTFVALVPGRRGFLSAGSALRTELHLLAILVFFVWLLTTMTACALLALRIARATPAMRIKAALGASAFGMRAGPILEALLVFLVALPAAAGLSLVVAAAERGALATLAARQGLSVPAPALFPPFFVASCGALAMLLFSALLVTAILRPGYGRKGAARKPWMFSQLTRTVLAVEAAASTALLFCAIPLVQSATRIAHASLGFDDSHLVVFHAEAGPLGRLSAAAANKYQRLQQALTNRPGVESATSAAFLPVAGHDAQAMLKADASAGSPSLQSELNFIGPGYASTLGTTLVAGRDIQPGDDVLQAAPAALVDVALAQRLFPGATASEAVGRYFAVLGWPFRYVIAGVIANARLKDLVATPDPVAYLPYSKIPPLGGINGVSMLVRTRGPAAQALGPLRTFVESWGGGITASDFTTERGVVKSSFALKSFTAESATALALTAAGIVAAGIFAVGSFIATRRSHALAVRAALGAGPWRLAQAAVADIFLAATAGTAGGLIAGAVAMSHMAPLLFHVPPQGVLQFVVCAGASILVATFAVARPALHAAGTDPSIQLREG